MSKRPIYLPIELLDVFELIEKNELKNLYFEKDGGLVPVNDALDRLKNTTFYIKQKYMPIEDQDVQL
ncbi:hypothetical protein [Enterococcus faecalis]|uniref:hypothetical protein n=1 Tax=Enterococcus faecalis TaxID=1351 RepID=UPI001921F020|nr:hypothetical protein [Enterococcus faecalis]MCD4974275.1 hypothetical protein [Enterococcus faecalis]MCD5228619.1 hypothetical protein [Enterococcus faecalis]MCD5239808.1 hypothetical protein [Enterococcus faecalis]